MRTSECADRRRYDARCRPERSSSTRATSGDYISSALRYAEMLFARDARLVAYGVAVVELLRGIMVGTWLSPVALGSPVVISTAGGGGSGGTSNPAVYTLIGAGIAAIASLLGVLMKAWLDAKTEGQKHAHEMAKLDRELAENRSARLIERRQPVFADALVATPRSTTAFGQPAIADAEARWTTISMWRR